MGTDSVRNRFVRRDVAVAVVLAATSACVVIAGLAKRAASNTPVVSDTYTTPYNDRVLTSGLDVMLVSGDGQAFAVLATDPLLSHPENFPTRAEAAYRAQRPLLGWVAWVATLGDPHRVPAALAVLEVLGVATAAFGVALLLANAGVSATPASAVVVLPGVMAALSWLGPEPLGLGLAAAGLATWENNSGRPMVPAVLFSAAALTRESFLVVPAGALLFGIRVGTLSRQRLAPLAFPFVLFATWATVLRIRVGSWPFAANNGRLDGPFMGLIKGISSWDDPISPTFALVGLAVVPVALLRGRYDSLQRSVVLMALVLALIMGPSVWARWQDFSRPLLPLYTFSIISLIRSRSRYQRSY